VIDHDLDSPLAKEGVYFCLKEWVSLIGHREPARGTSQRRRGLEPQPIPQPDYF
jgi:hypothetical protein